MEDEVEKKVDHELPKWMAPHLKRRPYSIDKDIEKLTKLQPVKKILDSGKFRVSLEGILQGHIDGTGQQNKSLRKLQEQIVPASQIESASQSLSRGPTPFVKPINDLRGSALEKYSVAERVARCKLASLYRLIDWLGWSQIIFNHISLRAPGKDEHFLLNAFGLHYSEVTASNLVKVDIDGNVIDPGSTRLGISKAGYLIHSAIHSARKDIRCIIHLHTAACAAVSSMKYGLLSLCQESLVCGQVSYHDYNGIVVNEAEKEELAVDLGPVNKAMILRNHGILAMGGTVEESFAICFNLVRACETQVMASSVGINNLILVENNTAKEVMNVASRSGGGVSHHGNFGTGELEFEAMMRVLDNLGYDTGYPYKAHRLLLPDPRFETRKSMSDREGTGAEEEIEAIGSKIREQIERLRKEKEERLRKMLSFDQSHQTAPGSKGGRVGMSSTAISSPAAVNMGMSPATVNMGTSPATVNMGTSPATVNMGMNPAAVGMGMNPAAVGMGMRPAIVHMGTSPAAVNMRKSPATVGMGMSSWPAAVNMGMSPATSRVGMSFQGQTSATPVLSTSLAPSGNWAFLDNRIASSSPKPQHTTSPYTSTPQTILSHHQVQVTPSKKPHGTSTRQGKPLKLKTSERNQSDNIEPETTSSSSSSIALTQSLSNPKLLTGDDIPTDKLAYHKQQIQSRHQQKHKVGKKGGKSVPRLSSSTSSSSLESSEAVISKKAIGNNSLTGLDKAIHTAEQVAQLTEQSLDKLSKSLIQQ